MSSATAESTPYSGRTAWVRNLEAPLRTFIGTETGSAAVLLAAAIAALVWVNVDASSYDRVWDATVSIHVGGAGLSHDLRYWLNSGLMTFFFFVVGLEARREFDLGELRERRRLSLPFVAGLCGMVVPVAIFLAFNAGHGTTKGWGVAMSTDTAFALGMLALVGKRFPQRLRAFMLTVSVVDDLLALVVIATAYTTGFHAGPLLLAVAVFAIVAVAARAHVTIGLFYFTLGAVAWVLLTNSGVDPIVIGVAMGLLTWATPGSRVDLERASDLFRLFREQPTAELAREARIGVTAALSPNERLQQLYHPWTSYLIVPAFALANAGVHVDAGFLGHAFESPITLGILVGYVVGKPVGIVGGSTLVTKLTRGRVRPPVGLASLVGGGAIAGIGFTVSLLIASLAFTGDHLAEAKVGVLSAALVASLSTWLVFRATEFLPQGRRLRALIGLGEPLVDLAVPFDPERDHYRGPDDAPVTIVEYGDFQCPYCGKAEPIIRELLRDIGDVRYVWRHLPLNDVHANAQEAAEASESAAKQGKFWEMHDLLLTHQDDLAPEDLVGYGQALGLDAVRFREDLEHHEGSSRIAEDVDSADLSNVSGTPTFFINGRRHYGAYDIDTLKRAVRGARARVAVRSGS
ncbi:MAG: Na+/H+ antiporter NhaA [Actinobacteria bacterium]|nr:Na+/H+ antiporter NhaA [Actinomycetota bacterium]